MNWTQEETETQSAEMRLAWRVAEWIENARRTDGCYVRTVATDYASKEIVIIGDWTTRETVLRPNGRGGSYRTNLHLSDLYPRLIEALEEEDIVFGWEEEWIEDSHGNCFHRGIGTYPLWFLTHDGEVYSVSDDFSEWIEHARDNADFAIGLDVLREYGGEEALIAAGFTKHAGGYENGHHPGQSDDPKKIAAEMKKQFPWASWLFVIDDSRQFDTKFSVWVEAWKADEGVAAGCSECGGWAETYRCHAGADVCRECWEGEGE